MCSQQGEQVYCTPFTSKISKTNSSFIRHLYLNMLEFFFLPLFMHFILYAAIHLFHHLFLLQSLIHFQVFFLYNPFCFRYPLFLSRVYFYKGFFFYTCNLFAFSSPALCIAGLCCLYIQHCCFPNSYCLYCLPLSLSGKLTCFY